MSSELTVEEKIGILNQHLKNLNQNKYNLFLTTLELGAVDVSSQLELQVIEDEIDSINSKINVLEQEKTTLEQE
jgi:hypothetical protein